MGQLAQVPFTPANPALHKQAAIETEFVPSVTLLAPQTE
jgi:hypothetical protein